MRGDFNLVLRERSKFLLQFRYFRVSACVCMCVGHIYHTQRNEDKQGSHKWETGWDDETG